MKLYSILLYSQSGELVSQAHDLSSFGYFTRGPINQFIGFATNLVASRIAPDEPNIIIQGAFHIYSLKNSNGCCCIVTDAEYPDKPAFYICSRVLQLQPSQLSQLNSMLSKYADPTKISKPEMVQNELEQTKAILNKTINSLLTRGEKLDDMVEKSAHLSMQTKEFYKRSRGNDCCFTT